MGNKEAKPVAHENDAHNYSQAAPPTEPEERKSDRRGSMKRSGSSLIATLRKGENLDAVNLDGSCPWIHPEYAMWKSSELEAEARRLLLWASFESEPIPLHLGSDVYVSEVSCGGSHVAVVSSNGELFTWGSNDLGQLGRLSSSPLPVPERAFFAMYMQALEPKITHVSCGTRHTVAITDRSLVLAFGDNSSGQCGYATGGPVKKVNVVNVHHASGGGSSAALDEPFRAAAVACGSQHTVMVSVSGEVYSCGDNGCGQLGVGDQTAHSGLQPVVSLLGIPVSNIAAGAKHSACVTVCGNVFVWGSNSFGQLGLDEHTPVSNVPFWLQFFIGLGASVVRCSANHTLVLTQAGEMYAFGDCSKNQIGLREPTKDVGAGYVCRKPMLIRPFAEGLKVCDVSACEAGGLAVAWNAATKAREVWVWGEGFSSDGFARPLRGSNGLSVVTACVGEGSSIIAITADASKISSVDANDNFCAVPLPDAPFPFIDGNIGKRLLDFAKESRSSSRILSQYLQFVMSHPACLNASFLGNASRFRQGSMASELNMLDVRSFFVEIQRFNSPLMHNAMLDGSASAIQYLYDHRLAHSPEILRMFLVLMDTPVLLNPDMRNRKILDQLLYCVLGLPQLLKTTLLSHIGEHSPPFFLMPVQIFQRFLSFLIQTGGHEKSITNCVMFLSYLNQINEVKRHVPFQQFYNDILNAWPTAALEQEYWKWRHRAFSFCQYPFLLGAGVKSEILQIDANVSMKEQMESAIISSVLRGEAALPFLVLVVRRDNLIQDALAQIQSKPTEVLKKPLKVKFVGEEGIDAGGVKKEFFQLLVRELLDPNYGMFVYNETQRTFWFNLASADMSAEFGLVGIMLGLAIYNGVILDLPFPLAVYKKLSNKIMTLDDVNELDPQTYKNLRALLDYQNDDIVDIFCLDFSVSYDYFGSTKVIQLIPNGENVVVNQQNKQEYVRLYVQWLLVDSIREQFDSFARGFRMVGGPTLSIFRPEELELLVCGSQTVNIDDLMSATQYKGGYTAQHKVIKWFWDVVKSWPVDKQKKLLTFATGSDRVPIKGLAQLGFIIQCNTQDTSRLPTASTCFNTLLLPCYASQHQLQDKLECAIENNTGFFQK